MYKKIFLVVLVSMLLLSSQVFALTLDDISVAMSNLFSKFFKSFFRAVEPPSISCNSCSVGACSCTVSNCQAGILDVHTQSECPSIPSYVNIISSGQVTWHPESGGTYYLKVFCDDGTKSQCTSVIVAAGATTTTQPTVTTTTISQPTTTTLEPTTTTQPTVTTTILQTTTTILSTTTTAQVTTTIPQATTTTQAATEFKISSVSCNQNECNIEISKNSFNEEVVIFVELVDDSGKVYYSSNLNLESKTTGQKKLVLSRVRTCQSGTELELVVLAYKKSDLNNRIDRISAESFVC